MVKPIFLVGLERYTEYQELDNIRRMLKTYLKEYYVIVYKQTITKGIEFRVIAEKDFNDIKVENEEIRQILTRYIKEITDAKKN